MDLQPGCIPMVRMGDDNTFVVGHEESVDTYSVQPVLSFHYCSVS